MFQSRPGAARHMESSMAQLSRGARRELPQRYGPESAVAGEVSGTSSPTDYTSQQVIDARYQEAVHRGDRILNDVRPITVKYDSNFQSISSCRKSPMRFAISSTIFHDGGKNARGLVRATGDLRDHSTLCTPASSILPMELRSN